MARTNFRRKGCVPQFICSVPSSSRIKNRKEKQKGKSAQYFIFVQYSMNGLLYTISSHA